MPISTQELFAPLPPEWPEDRLPSIRRKLGRRKETLVVLDDDPTGTQTVHDTPVLTDWREPALSEEFQRGTSLFYILTNSRSLNVKDAEARTREITANLNQASRRTGRAFEVVSRSDSTLRGHFPAEVDALEALLPYEASARFLIPFFEEGGRVTVNDVHYVIDGGQCVPAAETPFARDPVFGFSHSNLKQWVEEKTNSRIKAEEVASLSLNRIRKEGPKGVTEFLLHLPQQTTCVVNAASMRDVEVFVDSLLDDALAGRRFLYRTAASFVRARAGLDKQPLLSSAQLSPPGADYPYGGLTIVGSYVPKSTEQLNRLLEETSPITVEVDVEALLKNKEAAETQAFEYSGPVNEALRNGKDVVVFTSRKRLDAPSNEENLIIGKRVSAILIQIVRQLNVRPRSLVAKGGITSSDAATEGLDVRRAIVKGQILAGVPVWELGPESRFPGLNYIVFPGNVGGPDALLECCRILSRRL